MIYRTRYAEFGGPEENVDLFSKYNVKSTGSPKINNHSLAAKLLANPDCKKGIAWVDTLWGQLLVLAPGTESYELVIVLQRKKHYKISLCTICEPINYIRILLWVHYKCALEKLGYEVMKIDAEGRRELKLVRGAWLERLEAEKRKRDEERASRIERNRQLARERGVTTGPLGNGYFDF
jgi:hypothetical protein